MPEVAATPVATTLLHQDAGKLGIPGRRRQRRRIDSLLPEAVIAAFVSAVIYSLAGSYWYGYEEAFGLPSNMYTSLDISDLVALTRHFVVPLTGAVASSLILVFLLLMPFGRFAVNFVGLMFLVFLPVSSLVFWISNSYREAMDQASNELRAPIIVYYLLDLLVLRLILHVVTRVAKLRALAVPRDAIFRIGQLIVGCLIVVIFAYYAGQIDAKSNLTGIDGDGQIEQVVFRCPDIDGEKAILIRQTSESMICAEAMVEQRAETGGINDMKVTGTYRHFGVFKLPDDGKAKVFQAVRASRPLKLGLLSRPDALTPLVAMPPHAGE